MQGAQIPRNEAYREVRCNDEGCSATQPFGSAQGHEHVERPFGSAQDRESFDLAQDRELVERLVERPVEWQVDFLRSRQSSLHHLLECTGP